MWLRQGKQQHLLLNRHLLESQKAFELAREIAYNLPFLRHKETLAHRVATSPHVGIHSYTQILNEFKASYFAGAVLMPQEPLEADVAAWFQQPAFEPQHLWDMLTTYHVTPEMLLHRLTEILPGPRFGIKRLHFLRFEHQCHPVQGRRIGVSSISANCLTCRPCPLSMASRPAKNTVAAPMPCKPCARCATP
jgi:predicted transcriptional regulator